MTEREKYMYVYFKEWFICKTRMPGTVKCRSTVAYWVQIDGINIATELNWTELNWTELNWTDYKILPKRDIVPMLF